MTKQTLIYPGNRRKDAKSEEFIITYISGKKFCMTRERFQELIDAGVIPKNLALEPTISVVV